MEDAVRFPVLSRSAFRLYLSLLFFLAGFFGLFLFVGVALLFIGQQIAIQPIEYVQIVDFVDKQMKLFAHLIDIHSK